MSRQKKSWDKKHYQILKKWIGERLKKYPFQLHERVQKGEIDALDWAKSYIGLIPGCIHRGDYEGAQATRDAVIEFLNGFGLDIPENAVLNLPEYQPKQIYALLCFAKIGDPSGMANGGAMFINEEL